MGDMAFKNDVANDMAPVGHPIRPPVCPHLAPCLPPSGPPSGRSSLQNLCKTIAKPLQNHCKTIAKSLQNQTGTDGGPDEARRGGGRKDYLLLKEKMACSVYVSCKSSSAFDVFDTGWM
jgi:hypothetical protein